MTRPAYTFAAVLLLGALLAGCTSPSAPGGAAAPPSSADASSGRAGGEIHRDTFPVWVELQLEWVLVPG